MRTLLKWFRRALMSLGAFVAVMIVGLWMVASGGRTPKVPDKTIVELDLRMPIAEVGGGDPFAELTGQEPPTLWGLVAALDEAAADERVVGLVARVDGGMLGTAQAQELRQAVARFRASGKFAVAYSDSFGEFGGGTRGYWLASAFEEIWVQPSGGLALTGLGAEAPFFKEALDKLGVHFEGGQRKAYKTANHTFTETRFTPAHRESLQALLDDFTAEITNDVATSRSLKPADVAAAIDRAPLLATQAKELGLIDRIGYRDEAYAAVRERGGEDAQLLYLSAYAKRRDDQDASGTKVALVHGVGPVIQGSGTWDGQQLASDRVIAGLRAATKDDDVKAILFRVDSPGGSYVASDSVWRAVEQAKAAGKPVVVSFADVAGSGGYFVAMGADRIIAQPTTITGSIGVLAYKPVMIELMNKLGITVDQLQNGKNALMFSTTRSFSAEQKAQLDAWLDHVYADFTTKVGQGRKLDADKVEAAAQGRIWSGRRALELGLVDGLGGRTESLAAVREVAGLGTDAELNLQPFPEPQPWWQSLLPDDAANSEAVRAGAIVDPSVRRVMTRAWQQVRAPAGVLSMPIDADIVAD